MSSEMIVKLGQKRCRRRCCWPAPLLIALAR